VAETASGYRTGKPFQGSRRYYRGRIVAALRAGSPRSLMSLGVTIKPGYGAGDEPWLREVVDGLVRDGLATWVAGDSGAEVSLP
jgi:A/G-specific adenine glycosylase